MSDTKKYVDSALSPFLGIYNFKKRGNVWALRKGEFLLTIELQKSQWSAVHYINVGFHFEDLDDKLPKNRRADIQYRLTKRENPKDTFSLEIEVPLIQQLIREQVIEPFASVDTLEEIKKVVMKDPMSYLVTQKCKKLLGL